MSGPDEHVRSRLDAVLGAQTGSFLSVSGGYSPAERWRFQAGNRRYFVKIATDRFTRKAIRAEFHALAVLRGDFLPEVIATEDDPERPLLVLEDLGEWHWPPPWSSARIDTVLAALDLIHGLDADLPEHAAREAGEIRGWVRVQADPEPFLSLGLVTRAWLTHALPDLVAAEAACDLSGTAVCHWDLRSDNMCFRGDQVKFIDWDNASLSCPRADLGAWLPSLESEGGPQPEVFLGPAPEIAAYMAGYFAECAGLPVLPSAPRVRVVQQSQLRPALRWAVRALKLAKTAA